MRSSSNTRPNPGNGTKSGKYGNGTWRRPCRPTPAIAYFYCFDNADPDAIVAFQQYVSAEAAGEFLKTDSYAAYLQEVEPLLSGPPQVTALTPMWSKEL